MSQVIYDELKKSFMNFDDDEVVRISKEIVNQNLDAAKALNLLIGCVEEVGNEFERGEIYLPELMIAGEAMKSGMSIFLPAIPAEQTMKSPGTVVLGTVKTDIHDIGKNIVKSMLQASGFTVIDLGIDVPPSQFAEAAKKNHADVVAASAIMSTTAAGLGDVVEYFKALGIKDEYKIIVGGGACSQELADQIEADGYGEDAAAAVKLVKDLINCVSVEK